MNVSLHGTLAVAGENNSSRVMPMLIEMIRGRERRALAIGKKLQAWLFIMCIYAVVFGSDVNESN